MQSKQREAESIDRTQLRHQERRSGFDAVVEGQRHRRAGAQQDHFPGIAVVGQRRLEGQDRA